MYAAEVVYAPADTVTIGDFVYNDDFTVNTGTCTVTVYSPSGSTLVNAVSMTTDVSTGWHHYDYTAPSTNGKYAAFMSCGTAGVDLVKEDKSFIVKSSVVTDSSIATAVWGSGSRTLTAFGSLAADVWNGTYASVRNLTDAVLSGGGTLATKSDLTSSENNVIAEVQVAEGLISALNNISAADVWAYGTRSINSGTTTIDASSVSSIWNKASSALSTSGSIGKLVVDNLDAQVSSRGTSTLTAGDVWASATRTLSTTGVDAVSTGVWANAGRTLTNYGNDITAADVWNVLASSLTATGSIGKQLALNIDGSISDVLSGISTNNSLISSLNNISAADVWSYGGAKSVDIGSVTLDSGSVDAIWEKATSGLSTSGSIGKLFVDNLDAQVSSRGTSNLSAADVWSEATRTLTDYGTSDVADAVWASGARTLTNYGNDITAADVWNTLSSSLTTVDSIGAQLATNTDAKASDILAGVAANTTAIAALNNITAADVWAYGSRSINSGTTTIDASSVSSIWNKATSALSTSGSIGKLVVDNLDAQVSSRGTGSSTLTAADVWNSATRTLSTGGVSAVSAGVWADATRTLTNYGNDITAADVWNVLSSTLTNVGSIGKQIATNVDAKASDILSGVSANTTLLNSLNNISAADVWAYGTRSVNSGTVDLSTASKQAIWDVATSGLSTTGSIGKKVVDNLDAQVSSRGTSSITAADVWASATRTLSTTGVDAVSAGVWANGARTLTNYGNNITAADVWNVLSSSLTTVNSIGKQLATNVDAKASDLLAEEQANGALISSLSSISASDVWNYAGRSLDAPVDLSTASKQQIWDVASADLSTAGSIGKSLVDNIDAKISTRGVSNLTAADVWSAATRTLSDYHDSAIATAVWANATRTLSNYGNDITAEDVWNVLSSSLTVVGSIGEQVSTNLDAPISAIGGAANWSVKMGNVERVQTGQVYRTKVFILDASANPTAPFATPTVTTYDVDRNVVVSNVPMTLVSTGVYEYSYTVSNSAAQGLWETVASTQVESGKTIQTNDYWEVAGSPAQVLINSVTATGTSAITGNVTVTNEGLTGYEYQYEWCVVSNINNACGGGDDAYHATAAKFINPGEDWNTALTASVSTVGTYYFKLVVYFGTDSSSASRVFTVASSGGGGGGGGGSSDTSSKYLSADLNQDGFVNSVDFSILLAFWKTNPPYKNTRVDINNDKAVNSIDFSIMMYQWNKKP